MNNYILEYYQKIKDGTEASGHWLRLMYEKIVKGIETKEYVYSQKKAEHAIRFIESFCRHHEGALAPSLIRLELWQKAFLSVVFGIMDETGRRMFREVFLVVGRKNGKTLIAAAIAAYMIYADGEYGARVYFTAPKLEQARICYEAFFQMVQKEPELAELSKKRRTDVYIEANNASAAPMPFSAKKSDGLNIHLGVCDEIAAWQGDAGLKQYEVEKSSMGARSQPILLPISTAGYVEDGIFDELMKRATAFLNGSSHEKRLAPFIYMIDDPEKWQDINELRKANPNLGVSVSVDYMLEEIAVAEGSLSKKTEFLTKYCNIKQNSSQAWLNALDVKKCFGNSKTFEDFRHTYALGGIDLSLTTDLTAAVILIEKDGVLWFFTKFFMPANRIQEAEARDGLPYRLYIQRGLLQASGENNVDYNDCFAWFEMLRREYEIYPLKIGYDRYSAQYLVDQMTNAGYHMESVSQGSNLTGVLIDMEGAIKDGLIRCGDDNDLMKVHMLDSALKLEDGTNRRRLIKISSKAHIDGMAALSDAMCMRRNYYTELANQLRNAR